MIAFAKLRITQIAVSVGVIMNKDEIIQELKEEIERLGELVICTCGKKRKEWWEDFNKEMLAEEIQSLKKQINCVKNHPEIKPLNCCWIADSLELKERRTDAGWTKKSE